MIIPNYGEVKYLLAKSQKITNVGRKVEKVEVHSSIGENVKWCPLWSQCGGSSMHSHDPGIPLLGADPEGPKWTSERDLRSAMCNAKMWKHQKCPDRRVDRGNVAHTCPESLLSFIKRRGRPCAWQQAGTPAVWNKTSPTYTGARILPTGGVCRISAVPLEWWLVSGGWKQRGNDGQLTTPEKQCCFRKEKGKTMEICSQHVLALDIVL